MLFVFFAMVMALAAMAEAATFNPFQHTIVWQNVSSIGKFTMKKPGNGITHPDDYIHNPVFEEGDEIMVAWTTVMPFIDLLLLQPAIDGSDNAIELISNLPSSKLSTFNWQVSGQTLPGGITPIGQMYYVMVRNSSNPNQYFTSSFFNVSSSKTANNAENPTATSTASQATVTVIANYGAQTSVPTPSDPSQTDGADAAKSTDDADQSAGSFMTQAPSQSTKISGAAIGGILVGVALFVAAAAVAAWRLWWIPRKRKATEAATVSHPPEYWASEKDPYPTWEPPTYHESIREAKPKDLSLPNPSMLEQGAGVMVHEMGPTTPKTPERHLPYRSEAAALPPPMPTTPKSPGGPVELP